MVAINRPPRMVSKGRWRIDNLYDADRMKRLVDPPPALDLLQSLVQDAVSASESGKIVPSWDPCISEPTFGRIMATIPVGRDLFDQLFNGRSGYRAQYCLSVAEGRRYNRAIIDALVPVLERAHSNRADQRLRWLDSKRSLLGSYSKIWIADDEEAFQNAPCALHVPGWCGWGCKLPLPTQTEVDVKGTFIRPDGCKEITTKPYRDRDLHREGSPR